MQPNDQQPTEVPQPIPQPPVSPVQPQTEQVAPVVAAQQEPQVAAPVAEAAPAEIAENYDGPAELPEIEPVTWQFEEYAQSDKTPVWYIILTVVVLVLMGLAIWLSAWTFAVLIPVMVVALMVYAHRPPQLISYTASEKGIYINDTLHPMGEFKAFAVGIDSGHNSLMLIPVKRFRPALKVSFPEEIGERLVDVIGAYLPSQEYRIDAFDKLIQKLHI